MTDTKEPTPESVLATAEAEEAGLPPAPSDALAGLTSGPESPPPRTPEHLICLRGPCKFYWNFVSKGDWGNPSSTWTADMPAPRVHHHVCLRSKGLSEELDFSEEHIYSCNQWAPMSAIERASIENRRRAYFDSHPEHSTDPLPEEDEQE